MKAKEILNKIKNKGYRYSVIRESILNLIIKSKKPLSYFNIHDFFNKKKMSANKTTIYRELVFLKEQKIIRELQFKDGVKYYEIMPEGHHHHIICNECETIEHIELNKDLEMQEKAIFENNKFKVIAHSLEFYGLCNSCIKDKV